MSDENTVFWKKIEEIEGLSLQIGLNHVSGQKENYEKSLKLIMKEIDKNDNTLVSLLESGDMHGFSTMIHGMKGTLAFIGTEELSAKARNLEKAANLEDKDFCALNLPVFLEGINKLKNSLTEAFKLKPAPQGPSEKPPELALILQKLTIAFNETDFSAIDDGIKSLDALKLGGELYEEIEKIKDAVLVMEYETALEIIGNMVT